MLKDHTNTYQNNAINSSYYFNHFKYGNMIIVNMNDAWAFQSEGRKTNNVPTAASPKRKSSPPFWENFHLCGVVSTDTGSFEIEFGTRSFDSYILL
jgi:hypothetical protein